jgi:hypothetical protein
MEWTAAIIVTLGVLYAHFIFFLNAGPLWRDEVSSVDLASLPSLGQVWGMLTHDSFPLLWSLVLRGWMLLGLGGSDFHLRALGLLTGISLLASLWTAGLILTGRPPLLALGLFASNTRVLWESDSLRAYGLGTTLIILTIAFVWKYFERPTRGSAIAAAVVACASVHALFQNAFLLLAVGLSAAFLATRARQWRKAITILGIGALAGVSLLPYIPGIVKSQEWWILEKTGFQPAALWGKASEALGFPWPWVNWLWVALTVLGVISALTALFMRPGNGRAVRAYSGLSLLMGTAAFILFLKLAGLPTQPWYYLALMGFIAACLDAALAWSSAVRALLVVAAMTLTFVSLKEGIFTLRLRQTNIDLLAKELAERASPDDLIVLNNWYYGVTFQRYYHGKTPWITVPPLDDLTIHRYDLMKLEMQKPDAIAPVREKAEAALRSGHRVWLIGIIPIDGSEPPSMQPAPNNPWGWLDHYYTIVWRAQFGYFISQHAAKAEARNPMTDINRIENAELVPVWGWRE